MNKIDWLPDEELLLRNNYGKIYTKDINKLIPNKTKRQIYQKAKKLGLKSALRTHDKKKKYQVNEDFWAIPNEINCYYAGNFAADACIRKRKLDGSEILGWEISVKDLEHMKLFLSHCGSNNPIRYRMKKSPNSENTFQTCSIDIFSKKWFNDLGFIYNIVPNKTQRLAPVRLNNEYLEWCYIIGLIDGDGHICLSNPKEIEKIDCLRLGLTSSSLIILKWVCDKIEKLISYNYRNNQDDRIRGTGTSSNCKRFEVNGLKASLLIYFLSKFPVPKLARKWEQSEVWAYINNHKSENPEMFNEIDEKFSNLSQPVYS